MLFLQNAFNWFKVVPGVGYVPTEKASKEATERYNKNHMSVIK